MSFQQFDIDHYLNPHIPRSILHLLPDPISHFLGHRGPASKPQVACHPLLIWFWCFFGAFCGVAVIEGAFEGIGYLGDVKVPVIIGSFGAAAILEYNTIESPLGQPRNLLVGHILSAVIGVGIMKLFELLPEERFLALRWLAGALAVGVSSVVMSMTKTVHPPAGATALLTATTPEITILGWWVVPLVTLGGVLMLVVACILNNIHRRFPVYWWTPANLGQLHDQLKAEKLENAGKDIEYSAGDSVSSNATTVSKEKHPPFQRQSSQDTTIAGREDIRLSMASSNEILITKDRLVIPSWLALSDFEATLLQEFQQRLHQQGPTESGCSREG